MQKHFIKSLLPLVILLFSSVAWGQGIESIKLTNEELPAGYKQSSKMLCKSVQALSFYEQTDLYESFLGKIKSKSYQTFESRKDKGSVLYFEFENYFTGEAFLLGYLWGGGFEPTKSHPEEYYVKGKYLIIWSFDTKSEIKKISKEKVKKVLSNT